MKAIIVSSFGDEEVLKYQETETPTPAAGEVRVKIKAAGVNPVETYIRSGHYTALPALPYTPGNDGSGIVDAVGDGVEHLKKGDRVFVAAALARRNTGTYAEYTVCDADAVRYLPQNLSFSEGAALGTPGLAATYALYSKAKIKPGETVFIHGASGGVGSLAVQLARRTGTFVMGTAGDPEGMTLIEKLGAHRAFNHRSPGYLEAVKQETGEHGPDVIIEMVANINLNFYKLWPLNRGYRLSIKSSKGLENKGFFAVCSPYSFIRFHNNLFFPRYLIREKLRERKSHNKI